MPRPRKNTRPFADTSQGPEKPGEGERLQKVLAAAGVGSRRECEELIETGRVEVDRKVVTELGTKVDPQKQEIRVDGVLLRRPKLLHYMVNKPKGVVSTSSDPSGRPRVIDLVPSNERLFTVGRLDMSSEGLIVVTNDGELANQLTHPRYGVEKTYQVEVAGTIEREDLDKLRKGVHLAEGFAKAERARVKSQFKKSSLLEIVLSEGRNREIRRLLARVGHKVLRLKRIALGPLRLGELPPGAVRPLTQDEVRSLRQAAQGLRKRSRGRPGGKGAAEAGRPGAAAGRPKKAGGKAPPKLGGGTIIGSEWAAPKSRPTREKPPRGPRKGRSG